MSLGAGTAWISVKPNPTGWSTLKKSVAIAAPLAAVGAMAFATGQKFHEMRSAIITGTGASGKALKSLEQSAKNVGKQTPEDFKKVGEAIAEMNTATGATGKPLEDMTKAVLNASRLLGEDGVANSKAFGRALNQWKIPAKEGADTADSLFSATQKYGIGLGETTKNLSKYGATLQNAGFSMDESVAMFGRLSKGGVDLRRAMPGLNMAFRKWADEGKNGQKELGNIIKRMREAESGTDALKLATKTFGAEGAQQMVTAARSGGLELRGLKKDLDKSTGSIEDADKRNRTFSESWQILKNKGMAAIEPVATKVFNKINDGMKWIEQNAIPTLKDMAGYVKDNSTAFTIFGGILGAVVGAMVVYRTTVAIVVAVTKVWRAAQAMLNKTMKLNPIGLVVTAIALLVAGFVVAYKKSDTFRKIVDKAWAGIKKAVKSAWDGYIKPALKALWKFISGTLWPIIKDLWAKVVKPTFAAIGKAIKFAWNNVIKPALKMWWAYISNVLWPVIKFLWEKVVKPVFKAIGKAIKFAWDKVIKPVFNALKDFIKDKVAPGFRKGVDIIKSVWDTIKDAAKKPVNFVIDTVYNKGIRKAFNAIAGKIGGPELPYANPIGGGGTRGASSAPTPTSGPRKGGVGGAGSSVLGRKGGDEDAMGGPFGWVKDVVGSGFNWLVDKMKGVVEPLIAKVGDSPWAKMMGSAMSTLLNSALGFFKGDKDLKKKPKGAKGAKGNVLPAGAYSIGMPYLGYPGHYGSDYPASTGTPVRSLRAGVVSKAQSLTTSYGKHVYVMHGDGVETRYAHLSGFNVRSGQRVAAGQQIGAVGSTGNSTGPHLHFEYRKNGRAQNPASLGIFDRGGRLEPGMLAYHSPNMRKPDNVLTDQQFRDMHTLATRATAAGDQRPIQQYFPASATPESAAAAAGQRVATSLAARGF